MIPEEKGTYSVAVCQFEPTFLDKYKNLQKMEEMVEKAANGGAKLAVFPECCVTGYKTGANMFKMASYAESLNEMLPGPSIARLQKSVDRHKIQIIFGIPEKEGDQFYNSTVHLIPNSNNFGCYRKTHMWDQEDKFFAKGTEFNTRQAPLGRLGSLICYDLEFPEASRILALAGVNMIAVSTANMEPWDEYQIVLARARAMENNVFVAVANCIGNSGSTQFVGKSIIVDPFGRILVEAGRREALLIADIDLRLCQEASNGTSYLRKRRADIYNALSMTSS
jgi:predicted amidohydrolase